MQRPGLIRRVIAALVICLCVLPAMVGALHMPAATHAAVSADVSTNTPTTTPTTTMTGTATATPTATQTVQTSLTVTPSTVVAGGKISLTGSGFGANETVSLSLATPGNAQGGGQFALVHADGSGSFAVGNITVPATAPAGTYQILALGLTTSRVAHASLQVTAPTAAISVSRSTFSPTDTIVVTGTNFLAGEQVAIVLGSSAGGTSVPLGQVQADGNGGFTTGDLRIPFGVPAGSLTIVATGLTSARQASVNVTVTAATASLSVTPATANPNDTIAVSGNHFQPGETVTVDLVSLSSSTRVGTTQVDPSGSFTISGIKVPQNTPESTVSLVATGTTSHLTASTQLKVGSLPAGLTLGSGTVTAGSTLSLQATGFIPGETVTIQLTGNNLAVTLASAVVGTSGGINITNLTIPAFIPNGSYTITVTGQTSGRAAHATVTVQAPTTSVPVLSIVGVTPTGGVYPANPGGLLQVAGSNFAADATATLALVGPNGTVVLGNVKVNGNGTLGPVGITLPANTPAGPSTLQVLIGGQVVTSLKLQVSPLASHLTVSDTTVSPSQTITVSGGGFAPGEQIVLALNGSALVTRPATIIADSHGNFTASVTIPSTLTPGANTLTASGSVSRAGATVTLQGASLPVTSRFYFPHGDTTANHRTLIALLNPGNGTARVKMTFLYAAAPERTYSQTVPAHSRATVDLALAAGAGRSVSTIVESDHRIGAQSIVYYGAGDDATAQGATGPATTWYLAEGYTGGNFREFLTIMNPNTTFANVDVRFLPFNGQAVREQRFVVRPRSNIQIDAGLYMPKASISVIATSDKAVVVERTMRFGLNRRGAHDKIGVTSASTIWQFAEGESSASRQTFLTILNPSPAAPAAITATFFDRTGKPAGQKTIIVNPLHRGNIKLNDVLPNAQVATIVSSNVPIVVERPLYQGGADLTTVPSGSVVFGRNGGGVSWTFADGDTTAGAQTRFYLFNPSLKAISVSVLYYTAAGSTINQSATLPPNSVTVLDTASVGGLGGTTFGAVMRSAGNAPFIAEQAVLNPALGRASSTQGIAE